MLWQVVLEFAEYSADPVPSTHIVTMLAKPDLLTADEVNDISGAIHAG
jgi:hypothetical protein